VCLWGPIIIVASLYYTKISNKNFLFKQPGKSAMMNKKTLIFTSALCSILVMSLLRSSYLNAYMQVIRDTSSGGELGKAFGQALGQLAQAKAQQRQREEDYAFALAYQQYAEEQALQRKIREMKFAQEYRLQELARLQEQKQLDEQKRQERKQQQRQERQAIFLWSIIGLLAIALLATLGSLYSKRRIES
jgi:hypothetical protein